MAIDLKPSDLQSNALQKPSVGQGSVGVRLALENEGKTSNILNNERLLREELQEMHKDPLNKKSFFDFLGSWTEFGLFGAVIAFFALLLGAQHLVSKLLKDR